MSEDQFTKLLKYLQVELGKVRNDIDEVSQEVGRVYGVVDGMAKRVETDDQERAVVISQLNRHDKWIHKAASKLKIKYDNAS